MHRERLRVCLCMCVYMCMWRTLRPQRGSLLPGWVTRSVSPRRLPAQCPGSPHKAGGTSPRKLLSWWREKRVISPPYVKVKQSPSKTHFRDHHSSDKIASLTWNSENLISFFFFSFAFTRRGCLKFGMMLVWPLTFTFTDISKRRKRVKIKDVTLKKDLTSLLGLFRLCFCCNNDN